MNSPLAPLTKILAAISPPPIVITPDYDGLEFKWKFFTFRPALFRNELYFVTAVIVYLVFYSIGKKANYNRAYKWVGSHMPIYEAQFSAPVQAGGLTRDGNSDFFVFSTGRRAISSLHTVLTLRPRHDLFQLVYQFIRGIIELDWKVVDEVELDFTFQEGSNVPECIWAVVSKDELRGIRDRRWDLSFTRTTDHPSLPPSLTVMSEFADVTENMFKQHGPFSLSSVLSSPELLPYFRSLSLTDQPRTRPLAPLPASQRTKHLTLSLALPRSAAASTTLPIVDAAFKLVDIVTGTGGWGVGKGPGGKSGVGLNPSLKPETRTKLRVTREKLGKELKEEAVKEQREEAEEKKVAAKKKAEEERLSKLSAAEQKKQLERDRKRMLRKTQGKVAKAR